MKTAKRITALLLVVLMALTVMPMAFAISPFISGDYKLVVHTDMELGDDVTFDIVKIEFNKEDFSFTETPVATGLKEGDTFTFSQRANLNVKVHGIYGVYNTMTSYDTEKQLFHITVNKTHEELENPVESKLCFFSNGEQVLSRTAKVFIPGQMVFIPCPKPVMKDTATSKFLGWALNEEDAANGITSGDVHLNEYGQYYVGFDFYSEDRELDLYAVWEDIPVEYAVEYYQQNEDGTYELAEKVEDKAVVGTEITAEEKEYEGFTFNKELSQMSGIVAAPETNDDGVVTITTLKVYYDLVKEDEVLGDEEEPKEDPKEDPKDDEVLGDEENPGTGDAVLLSVLALAGSATLAGASFKKFRK